MRPLAHAACLLGLALTSLPAWTTGRIKPKAASLVDTSLAKNSERQALVYGFVYRLLLWGGDQPLRFVALVGSLSVLAAGLVAPIPLLHWEGIEMPSLANDYSHAVFFGTAWAVQATLAALVYPIVISFIAIILQRRATSKMALGVYLLDSGVVPAGTSSIALVSVMTVQYFASLYADDSWVIPALVFNGCWLTTNIALTGFFLARTLRFIQDEAGNEAYVRLTVNNVLRAELIDSLKKHLVVGAPKQLGWNAANVVPGTPGPQVVMHSSLGRGKVVVSRSLSSIQELDDVHLAIVGWVARRWVARATKLVPHKQATMTLLSFPALVGEPSHGTTALCLVDGGPLLTTIEAFAVQVAFVYRTRPRTVLAPKSAAMLEELSTEVQSLAEQRRYSAAREALYQMAEMHGTLIRSCEEGTDVTASAADLVQSPYAWGGASYHAKWLSAYRPIAVLALRLLEEDRTLFDTFAYLHVNLMRAAPSQTGPMVSETLLVPKFLAYQMGLWWTKKMQAGSGLISAAPGSTNLAEPYASIYEQAVITFVGAWSALDCEVVESPRKELVWHSACARASAYMKHIEDSAKLVLGACARGDEVASEWYSDQFLKWWGNRAHELDFGDLDYDPDFAGVHVSLATRDWAQASELLTGRVGRDVGVDVATQVLSLAVRRYWEAMRLLMCGLLLQQVNSSSVHRSIRLRIVASYLSGMPFRRGGFVEAWSLAELDFVLAELLGMRFGDQELTHRLDNFCENLRWEDDTPQVSGWMYSGTHTPRSLRFMGDEFLQVMLSLRVTTTPTSWTATRARIESWWRDVPKLNSVADYGKLMRKSIVSKEFRGRMDTIQRLRSELKYGDNQPCPRHQVAGGFGFVRRIAELESGLMLRSMEVQPAKVASIARRISEAAFGATLDGEHYSFCKIAMAELVQSDVRSIFIGQMPLTRFTEPAYEEASDSELSHDGRLVRQVAITEAFDKFALERGLAPLPGSDDATFIAEVAARCVQIASDGKTPVILESSRSSRVLRPHVWRREGYSPLPEGVVLEYRNAGTFPSAVAYLNGAPIVPFETRNHACFVVPLEWISTLHVQGGSPQDALGHSFELSKDDGLTLTLKWKASF